MKLWLIVCVAQAEAVQLLLKLGLISHFMGF